MMRLKTLREHPRRAGRYVLEIAPPNEGAESTPSAPIAVAPISVETIAECSLRAGMAVDEALLVRLQAAARRVECYDRATDALARRARSRADLERWLRQRGHARDDIMAATDRLAGLGLLDDVAFAQAFVRSRIVGRGFGPRRVVAELGRHGVDRRVADRVLAEYHAELPDAAEMSVEAAARKRVASLGTLEPTVALRRLTGWLIRRGFGAGEAARAARRALEDGAADR